MIFPLPQFFNCVVLHAALSAVIPFDNTRTHSTARNRTQPVVAAQWHATMRCGLHAAHCLTAAPLCRPDLHAPACPSCRKHVCANYNPEQFNGTDKDGTVHGRAWQQVRNSSQQIRRYCNSAQVLLQRLPRERLQLAHHPLRARLHRQLSILQQLSQERQGLRQQRQILF